MKIYSLTSSFHLHETIESDIAIEDEYHTTVPVPEGFERPKFVNGIWIDESETQFLESIAKSVYAQNRFMEYPPITDYIDGVVKGDQEQIQAYIDACLAVKAKYPKPEGN